uniref:VanW family protein n=1 Tax=Acetivibrio cellulolyticus TaxID=35830 RepID=UPI001F22117D|nr:VanW family protein [Acetivibrio cellulolyticus]
MLCKAKIIKPVAICMITAFITACSSGTTEKKGITEKKILTEVNPIVEDVKPDITSDTVRNSIIEIASYSTKILDDQKSRVSNIEIAGNYIDNVKVMPKEEFSVNGTLGRRTSEKGYKKAPIIIKSKDGPKKGYGVGGGICQIATTLYNAALEAGLSITERHPHSNKVGYVGEGKDATVVYGGADLKFINNRSNPIVIKVSVAGDIVTVKLYEIKDTKLP